MLLFFRSAGDGPDIYKGKICSLKARVRQFMKAVLFTPLVFDCIGIFLILCMFLSTLNSKISNSNFVVWGRLKHNIEAQ